MCLLQYPATATCPTQPREKGPSTVLGVTGTDEARVLCSVLDKYLMIRSVEELLQLEKDVGYLWEA